MTNREKTINNISVLNDDDNERGLDSATMTNGDWVRSLDDDALAKWLDIYDMDICDNCPKCDDYYCEEKLCGEQWQKWVKQEHKENSNEL